MMKPLKRLREEPSEEEVEGPCRKQQICYLTNTDETEEMDWSPGSAQLSLGTGTALNKIDTTQQRPATMIICYGSLTDSKAEVTYLKSKDTWTKPWTSFYVFNLENKDYAYRLTEDDGSTFGVLDNNTALQLKSIQEFGEISFRVVISSFNFSKIPKNTCSKKTRINVTINIFGPENIAEEVGEKLEDGQAYLQHPVLLEQGIKYANPHYFYDDETLADLRHLIGPMPIDNKSQQISRDIQNILESLDHVQIPLTHGFGIERIESLHLVETKLKPHQIEGVCFILSREDSSISEKVDREFRQLLDPTGISSQHAASSRGGIIADSMGLGKTLTMLSAIACSKEAAGEHLGPTLIVLPSRQVLDVWDSEIARRFHSGTFEVHHFHGCNRVKEATALAKKDIVLTTYQTLAADSKRGQILKKVGWLRVVLDEAHWIRNQSTQLFKAAESLRAETRWCLTGTPIQNSLHDLRSLLRFLRFTPIDKKSTFEKCIIAPLRSDSENAYVNLQYLLRILCLRRQSTLLELPPLETKTVSVALSTDEKEAYEDILIDCKNEFDKQVCLNQKPKTHCLLFATMMKLRRLCNHGTMSAVIDSSNSPTISSRSDTPDEDPCLSCANGGSDAQLILDGLEGCQECGRQFGVGGQTLALAEMGHTPTSETFLNVPAASYKRGVSSPSYSGPSSITGEGGFTGPGCSSKLNAVVSNILEATRSGSKSIAFTSWRLTSNMLSDMLSQAGVSILQIDGTTNSLRRSSIVAKFQEDQSIAVLIMTIDSCAVGLTLTNADQVHIIEPQWNPAIEAQAIGRAYRMGQTRPVTVIRYITEKSVEQNIAALQERKSRLAAFSLDDSADGDIGSALEDMKFVLNPEF